MSDVDKLVREALARHQSEVPMPEAGEARSVTVRARRRQAMNAVGASLVALIIGLGAITGVSALLRAEDELPANPTSTPTPSPQAPDDAFQPVAIPPGGVAPSTPEEGEVVIGFSAEYPTDAPLPDDHEYQLTDVTIFADGRVISARCHSQLGCQPLTQGAKDVNTGWVEQRLTPGGVELLRSELMQTGLLDPEVSVTSNSVVGLADYMSISLRNGKRLMTARADYQVFDADPPTPAEAAAFQHVQEIFLDLDAWLPASAWSDERIKAFVPTSYSFWFKRGNQVIETLEPGTLPPPADELLSREGCTVVTLDEARAIVDGFEAAGISRFAPRNDAWYYIIGYLVGAGQPKEAVFFEPIVPEPSPTC